jgi:uncharacterized protein YhfF
MSRTPKTDAYWSAFCADTGLTDDRYDVVGFGDSPAMLDELAALVLSGKKRATAGLARDFTPESLPRKGDHVVVVNGSGEPVCIYRSTDIRVGPLSSVDDQFAWDEGEGDRTRGWWLDAHHAFFTRQAAQEGFEMRDDIETVFERFTVIWPRKVAD